MARMIDADSLMKKFCVNSDGRRIPEVDCDNIQVTVPIKDIKKIIREQPTAYNVEKVVEEIEKAECASGAFERKCWLDKAVGIIRKGGVE